MKKAPKLNIVVKKIIKNNLILKMEVIILMTKAFHHSAIGQIMLKKAAYLSHREDDPISKRLANIAEKQITDESLDKFISYFKLEKNSYYYKKIESIYDHFFGFYF